MKLIISLSHVSFQAHFDNNQWIKKSVKLKPDAVPSLKCNFCPDKPQKKPKKTTHEDHMDHFYYLQKVSKLKKEESLQLNALSDHNYAKNNNSDLNKDKVQIKTETHNCIIRYKSPAIVYPKQIFFDR